MNALYHDVDVCQQKMIQSPGGETICGYPIRDLVVFADACRVTGVGPKELKEFVGNVEAAYDVVAKAMDEHLARCLEEYLRPMMRDGVEGGEGWRQLKKSCMRWSVELVDGAATAKSVFMITSVAVNRTRRMPQN